MNSSGLGAIDLQAIAVALNTNKTKSCGKYKKNIQVYKIGKYASENGSAASARHFKKKFLNLNEREFKNLKTLRIGNKKCIETKARPPERAPFSKER